MFVLRGLPATPVPGVPLGWKGRLDARGWLSPGSGVGEEYVEEAVGAPAAPGTSSEWGI